MDNTRTLKLRQQNKIQAQFSNIISFCRLVMKQVLDKKKSRPDEGASKIKESNFFFFLLQFILRRTKLKSRSPKSLRFIIW